MKEQSAQLLAPIDIDAFGIAMRNLIDNAISHGEVSSPIEILQTGTSVEVRNGGAPIPLDKLARLTQRFARASSRPEGAGLGLSIVDTIMTQTGGRIVLTSPAPGKPDGFSAMLAWPAAPAT
jgi:two-component system OmpR family sensor kinase